MTARDQAIGRLRKERMHQLAAFLKENHMAEDARCPEHGNTLIRHGDRAVCCIKGCCYEVPS